MATGVLPVVFGEATKFSQYGLDANKGYLARVQLGSATNTLDADGDVILVKPIPELTEHIIVAALIVAHGLAYANTSDGIGAEISRTTAV